MRRRLTYPGHFVKVNGTLSSGASSPMIMDKNPLLHGGKSRNTSPLGIVVVPAWNVHEAISPSSCTVHIGFDVMGMARDELTVASTMRYASEHSGLQPKLCACVPMCGRYVHNYIVLVGFALKFTHTTSDHDLGSNVSFVQIGESRNG